MSEKVKLIDELELRIDRKKEEVEVYWFNLPVSHTTVADAILCLENAATVVKAEGILENND